ncbi:Galactose-specific lectin nattectin [Merluccius polli]|uniref:Galactose-specific lectin nattectin n=1 Tax=Merluccius polli TaxID=89951 RepID=A0AA47PAS4_MERPO|nr:Galactose-specific lectin nattectin [Merluccius polli]
MTTCNQLEVRRGEEVRCGEEVWRSDWVRRGEEVLEGCGGVRKYFKTADCLTFITMATLWFLFAVLCVTTAAPADGGVKTEVAVVAGEDVPDVPALIPNAEEDEEMLRQTVLKQEEGVVKAAGTSEEGMEEVGEPLVEHTKGLQNPQSENIEGRSAFCPDGWLSHGSRCFSYVNNPLDWHSAEDHCQNLGGSLASIHNPPENRFLKQLVQLAGQSDVWIGAFYLQHLVNYGMQWLWWLQNRWRWIDGNGMYYSNWISASTSTSAPCTCLRNSGWAKASCASRMRFICAVTPGSC